MRVLVVAQPSIFPPSGPAYVAAALKRAGHEVEGEVFGGAAKLRAKVEEFRPDVLMAGGLCVHLERIRQAVRVGKDAGIITVIGGGLVSSEPELAMDYTGADCGIIGQGEETACELVADLRHWTMGNEVAGLIYRSEGKFRLTKSRPDAQDLDALPFPDYDAFGQAAWLDRQRPSDKGLLSVEDYPREYALVASRSCPFHCTFCWHTSGGPYRQRSVSSVMAELESVVRRHRINIVTIVDELFAVTDKRVREFCAAMKAFREELPWTLRWNCGLRVGDATAERLDTMKDAGCYAVGFGLESYSATVLKSMKKRTTPDQIRNALALALERGMECSTGNFIFGDPAETLETAGKTLRFWRANRRVLIQLGTIVACPDSEDYRLCLERGLIKDKLRHLRDRMYEPLNMTAMPDRDFRRLAVRIAKANTLDTTWVAPDYYSADNGEVMVVTCPHCGERSTYCNFSLGWGKPIVTCRNCSGGFFVSRKARIVLQRLAARLTPEWSASYLAVRTFQRAAAWARKRI